MNNNPGIRNAALEAVRDALKPFAEHGDVWLPGSPSDDSVWANTPDETELQLGATPSHGWTIKVGDLRRAREALRALEAHMGADTGGNCQTVLRKEITKVRDEIRKDGSSPVLAGALGALLTVQAALADATAGET